MSNIQIIQGDCLEIMPTLSDKSVDMILCDLPYGTTACKWDTIIPFEPLWAQYKRLIKDNGAIVLTASQPFTSALVMSNPVMFKHEWVWRKNRGSNFANTVREPFKEHESGVVFASRKWIYNPQREPRRGAGEERAKYKVGWDPGGDNYRAFNPREPVDITHDRLPSSVQDFNTEVGLHPTQKPVALFEYLIRTYTNEGDTVLDNCAGSGTTGVACLNTNRKYILIEKESKYIEIITERINRHKQQTVIEFKKGQNENPYLLL